MEQDDDPGEEKLTEEEQAEMEAMLNDPKVLREWKAKVDAEWKTLEFKHRTPPDAEMVDRLLAERVYVEGVTAQRGPRSWCLFCKPAEVPAVADSMIRGSTQWTFMCREHYLEKGTVPGEGSSQILIDGLVKPSERPTGQG